MALAETTLSSAVSATQNFLLVASATSFAAGRRVEIDGEVMQVRKDYSSGTTIPVLRALEGTPQKAHVSGARVTHGDGADWPDPVPGTATNYPTAGLGLERRSYSAAGAIELPKAGGNMLAILNGTSVVAATIAAPSKDMDGSLLIIASNGAAAHTLTFANGLSGAGSSYDVITINATAPAAFVFIAVNEVWLIVCAAPMGGTVTNIIGSLA